VEKIRVDREQIIKELVAQGWSRQTLSMWRRANYKCEYCGKSLIDSADDYFFSAEKDHVVPGAGEELENLALACRVCNRIKRRKNFTEGGTIIQRSEIIAKAAQYIAQIRKRDLDRLAVQLKLLRSLDKT